MSALVFAWLALRFVPGIGRLPVPGRGIFLLRAFFPSWKFFDELGEVPALEFRFAIRGVELGPWISAADRPRSRIHQLLYHAEGNLYLANQSLLKHLLADLAELQEGGQVGGQTEVQSLVSYDLVQRWVRQRVRTIVLESSEGQNELVPTTQVDYQFRLRSCVDPVFLSRSPVAASHSLVDLEADVVLLSGVECVSLCSRLFDEGGR